MSVKKWNIDNCREEASKYKTRGEFMKNCKVGYNLALKKGWLKDYDWFIQLRNPKNFWNYETCYQVAKKYTTRSEFQKGSSRACEVSRINKCLDDYVWLENKNIYVDKVDCVYAYFFENKNAVYIGRTINRTKRDRSHVFGNDTVSKYAKENDCAVPKMIILEDNLTIKKGVELEGYWVKYYKDRDYVILNKLKTGSIGSIGQGKWTKKTCHDEAYKYTSISEFRKGNGSAYQAAWKNNWLKDYDWFISYQRPSGYWSVYNNCKEEASKYKSMSEFMRGSMGAYTTARINNWLDGWFIRLHKPNGFWTYGNCKEEASKYKTRGEFRKGSSGSYNVAWKNKWLDNFYSKNN